ncbi:MAG: roadblock/LC7 domain-containing protein [Nannocystaceae bacterium]
MSRSEKITELLRTLSNGSADIEAAAVVDNDGLLIASALPADIEEERVAAMSAALLGMSERIVRELARGEFSLVMIRGSEGFTIVCRCGEDAVLTLLAAASAKLGLIFLDVKRAAAEISKLIT